ncbi:MAG: uroporphyrinogen-III synthase [Alkalilacustris sp.]
MRSALNTPPILILTRPRAQSERFAASLTGDLAGLPRLIAPLIEIAHRPLDRDPTSYATLVFTSENGVAAFAAQTMLRDRPAWCVGPRTEAAARDAGFTITHRPEGGDAEALIAALRTARPDTPLLHLRGAHAVTDLAGRLTAAGLACDAAVVYDQAELSPSDRLLEAMAGPAPVLLPLFSPRSARLAARAADLAVRRGATTAPVHAVAISAAAARRWREARSDDAVTVAARPDASGMLDALGRTCRTLSA